MDQELLKAWFSANARSFPWRKERTLYRVLVSEWMLQQTRAEVVVPYFIRWMECYPTLISLREAKEEDLIKLWEGLGYYNRVRYLKAASFFLEDHRRYSIEELEQIKGIGPYTARAVAAFAFKESVVPIDGNVRRVLSRYFATDHFESLAQNFLPQEGADQAAEGLIELGATLCKPKNPSCIQCPLRNGCRAFEENSILLFPSKKKRVPITNLEERVFILTSKYGVAVRKIPKGERMADLYEFFKEELSCSPSFSVSHPLPPTRMSYTRFRVFLTPFIASIEERPPCFEWIPLEKLSLLPFTSGHRKILHSFLSEIAIDSKVARI